MGLYFCSYLDLTLVAFLTYRYYHRDYHLLRVCFSDCQICKYQDVGDVLAALNQIIKIGLADPNKISLMGGSHGGFLVSHLLGQVSELRQVTSGQWCSECIDFL